MTEYAVFLTMPDGSNINTHIKNFETKQEIDAFIGELNEVLDVARYWYLKK